MTAYCGLECGHCPIHLATLEPDELKRTALRLSIARECTDHYGMNLRADEIGDCDGCRSETGRIFGPCNTCEVRRCARTSRLESCAFCPEFACEKLHKVLTDDPGARGRLEALRAAR